MHNIIGTISESADFHKKCKHRPYMKNRYALPIKRKAHMCSGCDRDEITSAVVFYLLRGRCWPTCIKMKVKYSNNIKIVFLIK